MYETYNASFLLLVSLHDHTPSCIGVECSAEFAFTHPGSQPSSNRIENLRFSPKLLSNELGERFITHIRAWILTRRATKAIIGNFRRET